MSPFLSEAEDRMLPIAIIVICANFGKSTVSKLKLKGTAASVQNEAYVLVRACVESLSVGIGN